jgi:hypothetical protein
MPIERAAAMFILCFGGMMIGLSFDLQRVLPEAIASLCTGRHSLSASVFLHSALLPATNAFMFLGGLTAVGVERLVAAPPTAHDLPARLARTLGCDALMLAGMFIAEWLGPQAAAGFGLRWSFAAMVATMATGMAVGMAAWEGLRRAAALRQRRGSAPSLTRKF